MTVKATYYVARLAGTDRYLSMRNHQMLLMDEAPPRLFKSLGGAKCSAGAWRQKINNYGPDKLEVEYVSADLVVNKA